jgi:AraC-like DNA-binding protein
MNFPKLFGAGMPIRLNKGLPVKFRGFHLAADSWFSENDDGELIIQQQLVNDKWLRSYSLKPKQKILVYFEDSGSWLRLLLNLGSMLKLHTVTGARINLRQSQYLLVSNTVSLESLELRPGRDYEFIEAWYSPVNRQEFASAFPSFDDFPPKPHWILPLAMDAVVNLTKSPYSGNTLSMYYDISLVNILFLLLSQSAALPAINATDDEMEAVYNAKKMLVENIKNYPGLKVIAQRVGLSDYRLRILLRGIYQQNAFDLFMKAKMDKAYQLVTTTSDSIKSIAIDTGYKWAMNFATAFRQQFGEAPETLREKLRHDKL